MKPVSRRDLVNAAALLPITAIRGTAANSAVKVGLIGSGGRGAFNAGFVDDRIEQDYRELLASDVDAVIIATPVFLHPEHFEAAVKAGKHIHAADPADRKIDITFGFQQRYVYLPAKALVDSGGIGKIRTAHAHWIKGAVPPDVKSAPLHATYEEKIRDWHGRAHVREARRYRRSLRCDVRLRRRRTGRAHRIADHSAHLPLGERAVLRIGRRGRDGARILGRARSPTIRCRRSSKGFRTASRKIPACAPPRAPSPPSICIAKSLGRRL